MSRADADLPWYFGSGASSLVGDSGLRSTSGGQLELAARLKVKSDRKRDFRRPGRPWDEEVDRTPESELLHPNPSDHCVDASHIEDDMLGRLGSVATASDIRARLQRLSPMQNEILRAHYSGESLPYTVDVAACLLARARRLCELPEGATTIPLELLRAALMVCTEDERQKLAKEADAIVVSARDAYDAVRLSKEERAARVQVDDPRAWKRERRGT